MKKQISFAVSILVLQIFLNYQSANSQNVAINSTGSTPDASAMLDISSTSKGLLIPRVSLTSLSDASTIATPATSLMVYNTNASLSGGVGYYYNSGTTGSPVWTRLAAVNSAWNLTGNSGTTAGTNFLGTTDNVSLTFKVNNVRSGFLDPATFSTFYGIGAGNSNSGNYNTAHGYHSLYNLTIGTNNAAFGYNTGLGITTGSNNTILGSNVSGLAANLNNTIILADGTGANKLYIDSAGHVGINTTTFDATNPEWLNVNSGTSSSENAIAAYGSLNDFYQMNIQNTNTGANAQAGYSATANNGTSTSGFVWMGINNTNFNFPTTYNIGGGDDASFLGSGNDLYIANANQTKSIIFSTGKSTTPYFNERMRITNYGRIGIGTNAPDTSALLDLSSTSKGLLVPRVSLASLSDASTITLPATSLMVYNTNASLSGGVGYYYNSGTTGSPAWTKIATTGTGNGSAWGLTGNSGTTSGTNFIGTTDNQSLMFKVNNVQAGLLSSSNFSVFFGSGAGLANTSGADNVGIGDSALRNNTTGSENTAIGDSVLYLNTTGNDNTAMGVQALSSNSTGYENTALGDQAAYFTTTGYDNTVSGVQSLYSNTVGFENTAIGDQAMYSNVAGSQGTAIGAQAMYYANSTSTPFTNYNVAVGYNSLRGSTTAASNTGNYNSALGYNSLIANTSGGYNSAFGAYALAANTNGPNNSAFGAYALNASTSSTGLNSAFGYYALKQNTNGDHNSAFGSSALTANNGADNNSAFGVSALAANTSGGNNSAFGVNALAANTTVSGNSAFGYNALAANTSGANNVGVGYTVLDVNTTGGNNTGVGYSALGANTTGGSNAAFGSNSLLLNTVGYSNSAFGYGSLYNNTTAKGNSVLGDSAFFNVTSGSYNTALGYKTGLGITTGANNTILGSNVSGLATNLNNTIILADGAGTNKLYIDSAGHTGINTNTFDPTNPEWLKVNSGTSTSENAIVAYGSLNDFYQMDIQNTNTGVNAQAGYSATANNGTETTGFAWMGINNTNFNNPQTYNIGFGDDVSFMGSGNDLYICNANTSVNRAIIFSTGIHTTPFFAERMRINDSTGYIGMGTNAPTSLLHLKDGHIRSEQTTKPTIAVTTQQGITAAALATNSTDMKGTITTTGLQNTTPNTVLTITFNGTYTVAPTVIITPANSGAQQIVYYVTSTTTAFTLYFYTWGSATNPSFNYMVLE